MLDAICACGVQRVVYVSCDVHSQARDVKYLCEKGFRLLRVQPVDMFPYTEHVENVCLLTNQNAQAKHHVNAGMDAEDYCKIKDNTKNQAVFFG